MLNDVDVKTMLPVKDLEAAERFYGETLRLEKTGGMPGNVAIYRSGGTTLCVYRSRFAGTNEGTAAMWEVADVPATVKWLEGKGVTFEHYDNLPGLTRDGDVHRGGSMQVAWFKDPSGNILSVQNRA